MEYCPNCKAEIVAANIEYNQDITSFCDVIVEDDGYIRVDEFNREADDEGEFWCRACNTQLPYNWDEMESWLKKNHSLDTLLPER